MAKDSKAPTEAEAAAAAAATPGKVGNPPDLNRRRSNRQFQARLQEVDEAGKPKRSPSGYLLDVLRGVEKYDAQLADVAAKLLPHEIPKLQAIEADIIDTRSHEDALAELDEDKKGNT